MRMKNWLTICFCLLGFYGLAQTGYEIKVTFKPYKNQYIYLGHYFGKTYPIIDSVKLDNNSTGTFKGSKPLQGGIYLVGYPNRSGFFEILLDKQQFFSVVADSATAPAGIQFIGSTDNDLFNAYQRSVGEKGAQINIVRESLKSATTTDSIRINQELVRLDQELRVYREKMITEHPNTILSALLLAMKEPVLPANLQKPSTREDSVAAFRYYKEHYWEGVNFWDGRLAYTTFFEDKLDRYFTQLVAPHPDSVNKEMDYMLSFAKANAEMERFLLLRFVNRYYSQRYMWEDAVFVHLYEKYFATNPPSWLSEQGKKTITDRAYSLMANIFGSPATEIQLPDSTGKSISLYGLKKEYTLVIFWDPLCGHCKETLPKIDSVYQLRWKSQGLGVYAVAKENEGTRKDWLSFIRDKNLGHWSHVYYSKEAEKERVSNNVPGYSQLYDVQSFPTLYLLDKDKRIVAKKLSFEQIDEILQLKLKEKK
jgi:thiol-disulfide isomerase/thioredoxin